MLVNNVQEAKREIESYTLRFKQNTHFVIEEFITGTEHTVEVLIWEGNTHVMSISDKINYPGHPTVVQDLLFPGPKGNKYRNKLETLLHKACHALELKYGCAHFEVMIDKEDKIWLIEVGGRPGGGLNFHPISLLTTGYDYPMEYAEILCTGKPKLYKKTETIKLYWHFFNGFEGKLKEVKGWDSLVNNKDVIEAGLMVKPGDVRSRNFENDLARPGHVLFRYTDDSDLKKKLKFFDDTVSFITD
jgi:biotin carboxylase